MKILKLIAMIAAFAVLSFFAFGVIIGLNDHRTPAEKARDACDEQFPYDNEQSNSCQIAILLKDLQDNQDAKLKRAYDAAH